MYVYSSYFSHLLETTPTTLHWTLELRTESSTHSLAHTGPLSKHTLIQKTDMYRQPTSSPSPFPQSFLRGANREMVGVFGVGSFLPIFAFVVVNLPQTPLFFIFLLLWDNKMEMTRRGRNGMYNLLYVD